MTRTISLLEEGIILKLKSPGVESGGWVDIVNRVHTFKEID